MFRIAFLASRAGLPRTTDERLGLSRHRISPDPVRANRRQILLIFEIQKLCFQRRLTAVDTRMSVTHYIPGSDCVSVTYGASSSLGGHRVVEADPDVTAVTSL